MRTPRTRTQILAVVVPALLTAATALAPAAGAATGPSFTFATCSDTSFVATCQFTWTGGTSPYTATWTAVRGLSVSGGSESGPATSLRVAANCIPQNFYEVKVTVTDATGASATDYDGGTCD